MSKFKNLILISLTMIVVFGGMTFFGVKGKTTDPKKDLRYKEFRVFRGTYQIRVTAGGVVKPISRTEIKSKASGQIEALPIEEGQFVRKGSLIARLDRKDEQSAVSLAKADLEIAQAERKQAGRMFRRRIELFRKKIISEEEYDRIGLKLAVAKGKVVQASTTLSRAKERLQDAVVLSPIDGMILQKYVEVGQIISSGLSSVSGGTAIADIAAMKTVHIVAGIDEIDIGKVQIGQNAAVVAEAYPNIGFRGKIVRIAPEAKIVENVTLFDVIIEVENTGLKLKSGMNTEIEITILRKDDVLLVPAITLKKGEEDEKSSNTRQVLLKQGDIFVSRGVTIGLNDFNTAEVLSGLSEGDVLGVAIQSRLKEANERLENRIRKSRSFGASSQKKKGPRPK